MYNIIYFTYSVILIVLYMAVVVMFAALNKLKKRRLALPVMCLFGISAIDTYIIMLTEQFPVFATWYDGVFMDSPVLKTCLYLGYAACMLQIWNTFMRSKFSASQALSLILFGLWLIIVPLFGRGAIYTWLYYEGWSFFSILACGYGLWKLKKLRPEEQGLTVKGVCVLLIVTLILTLAIIVEDSYVIFNLDSYSPSNLVIQSRSYSEDILRVFYCVFCFRLFSKLFSKQWVSAANDFSLVTGIKDRPDMHGDEEDLTEEERIEKREREAKEREREAARAAEKDKEYKIMKYSQNLGLTERELQIFSQIASGKNNQEIAEELHVSLGTVKTHVHNIFMKADVTRRYELTRKYEEFDPYSKKDEQNA